MAYTSLDQFMADLPGLAAAAQAKMKGRNARICLNTKQGRSLCVCIADGQLSLKEQPGGSVDCTVTADEGVLLDLINGRLNPVTALMMRRVTVQGDKSKLLELIKLFG